jgi:MoxR-like ATPase
MDEEVPPAPDVGFFGRDETLLALDRAFDNDNILLLHAYAGSGKTTTAAEFARWYALTVSTSAVRIDGSSSTIRTRSHSSLLSTRGPFFSRSFMQPLLC